MPKSQSTHKSIRIFQSDLLETFTHVHPILPALMWIPVIVFLFSSVAEVGLRISFLFATLGVLVWTLSEYLLHRFAFHYRATSTFGKRVVFIAHGLHHDDPIDPTRLVMPPLPAVLYAIGFYFLFKFIAGPVFVYPFFGGFLLGYLAYDYIHYYVHHFQPKNKIGKFLKTYHMQHHYALKGAKWGVSSPLWDYIFRSVKEK